jgi:hypothetical protein
MMLCRACQAVPYRQMFRQMTGDRTVRDAFQWFHSLGSVSTEDILKSAFVQWHNTLSELRDDARSCPFCSLLHSRMEENWRFKSAVIEGDGRALWLEIPRSSGNPLSVWIGNARPEAIISGNYKFYTTPGEHSRY